MNYIEQWEKYLKDNPEGYWFKRKVYGWGWTPASWQGWAITLGYIVIILALAFSLDESSTDREVILMLFLPLAIMTAALIRICYTHGEKPKWQWGFPKEEENEKTD